MTATFSERVRAQLREELLDAAATAVAAGGWQSLRMQAIADQVGTSRRTVYNEFGNKTRLAEALVLRITQRFLDQVEAEFGAANELTAGWEAAVLSALRAAAEDPVLSAVLTGTASEDFLPLLTSEGTEVIDYATARLSTAVLARWPELPTRQTALAAQATVRLALSHIVRPGTTPAHAARDIAELATGYLAHHS
ncbi:MAG TPA: TetR family transcriptional regulator [Pseudonocardia sp.]|nr:TetR family transcriptional regulator [Pseudonocardia sp.]